MLNLISEEMRRDPYPVYAQLRAGSPVFHVPGADLWMLLDYESVKRALHDHEAFSSNVSPSRGHAFEWLMFMDPPRHSRLRAIVSRAFTSRSVAALEPRVREISRSLLDALVERGSMDVVADFATPLPMMVIAEMIGLPGEDWPLLRGWSEAVMNLASTIAGDAAASRAASEAFLAANTEMDEYFTRVCDERRRAPKDDLITRLVGAEVDGERLSALEILRFVQLLLAAGTETTTNLIDNAVLCFAEYPGEYERLRASPALLPAAIEEVLRFRAPAQTMFRAARQDVEVNGQVIPAGKMILTVIGSANRDERVFEHADRFDIARTHNPHLAFGHGIHFCLGAPLSRLEATVGLGDFVARVGQFELASQTPWTPRKAFHVHGPISLPIRFRSGR